MIERFNYPYGDGTEFRPIRIYLPPAYEEGTESYPVFYLLDGHNLFADEEAAYGKSWGLKDFLDRYDQEVIVVGVEPKLTGNNRLAEYCPYYVAEDIFGSGSIDGYGQDFLSWLVGDLKAYIDQHYRTQPDRLSTAIGGSSMGGLMAFYALMAHHQVFSKAAALSPSLLICWADLVRDWEQTALPAESKLYLSYGDEEIERRPDSVDVLAYVDAEFSKLDAELYLHIQQPGGHNEATWEAQNQRYFDFLWK